VKALTYNTLTSGPGPARLTRHLVAEHERHVQVGHQQIAGDVALQRGQRLRAIRLADRVPRALPDPARDLEMAAWSSTTSTAGEPM
jgi:hypothetical protein